MTGGPLIFVVVAVMALLILFMNLMSTNEVFASLVVTALVSVVVIQFAFAIIEMMGG